MFRLYLFLCDIFFTILVEYINASATKFQKLYRNKWLKIVAKLQIHVLAKQILH